MVVKGSADIFECIFHFKETDKRNFDDAEKSVKAEHEAKRNGKKNVACFENAYAKEKSERS